MVDIRIPDYSHSVSYNWSGVFYKVGKAKQQNQPVRAERLEATGRHVEVRADNNQSYKIVVAATYRNDTVRHFIGDPVTGSAGALLMADFHDNPIPIDVYVDSVNPENYYVDIADIQSHTPERIGELIKLVTQGKQGRTAIDNEKHSTEHSNPHSRLLWQSSALLGILNWWPHGEDNISSLSRSKALR